MPRKGPCAFHGALCIVALQLCAGQGPAGGQGNPHYWPMARGPIGSHSTSPYKGPRDLTSSLLWKWSPPEGRFTGGASNGATLIDDRKNIYYHHGGVIRKFTPDGQLLWNSSIGGNDIPALMDGLLYSTSTAGHVVAISMESGATVWQTPPVCSWKTETKDKCHAECDCRSIGGDIGAVGAHSGVVIVKTHEPPGGGACRAAGLNASTGEFLWDYATDHMVWNFYPMYADDGGSFLFQDSTGGVYRLGLDGREIWKAGGNAEAWKETWTDGGLQVGPNGVVYAMKALGGDNVGPGVVRAYRVADGKELWQSEHTGEVPNSWPVIGRMRAGDPLTVIVCTGKAGGYWPWWWLTAGWWGSWWETPPLRAILAQFYGGLIVSSLALGDYAGALFQIPAHQPEVLGLDAETGRTVWRWAPPPWRQGPFRSEWSRYGRARHFCVPNPVGNPTLDADGSLYLGMMDGMVYHLTRDADGPAVKEQPAWDAEAAFSSGGVMMAPGVTAIASCDTLFVFGGGP